MLTPEAKRLWTWLKDQPGLAGFVLIGGSALSMRIGHRLSEGLDLVYLEETLPIRRLEQTFKKAQTAGFALRPDDDEAAVLEFLDGGLELHDYQQDFIAENKIKLSLVTADLPLLKVLHGDAGNGPRLAELAEIFKSKCLVCAKRSKSRDWFDLYTLIRDHHFTLENVEEAFTEAQIPEQLDGALARLCSGKHSTHDEGYAHLTQEAPSLESIASFFRQQRDEYEVRAAVKKGSERPE